MFGRILGSIAGPIASRVAGAIAGVLTGALVSVGVAASPELATSVGNLSNELVNVATLAGYGIAHKLLAKEAK